MATQGDKYVLYYNPYSICSLMVLYTIAVTKAEDELHLEKRLVDIFHEEQFEEEYLCKINDHGQVPVLLHPTELGVPITESLEITHWLAAKHPSLIPNERREEIGRYLTDLHALNYFSLSFPGRPQIAQSFEATVNRRLADTSISDRYRKALEFKLGIIKRDKSGGLAPSETAKNEKLAKKLLACFDKLIDRPDAWIYGETPTALDTHLVVFIARMNDVGRQELIPEKVKMYGAWAMQTPEWIIMMDGRKTMVPK